ncbi:MAG: HVO_0476 family zinc finger protein [Thermoplasmatota archaeon]
MDVPNNYYIRCPVCGEETKHKILKGEVGTSGKEITIDGVVKCAQCGHTRHKVIRESNAIEVPLIISWKNESYKDSISLYPEEWIHKGDELIHDGVRVKVTSIEQEGKRVDSSRVEDIKTIWTRKYEKSLVKVSIHKGRNSVSKTLEVPPEEEFHVGDILEVGNYNTVIHRIKTKNDIVKKGKATAEDIVRIYAKQIR